MQRILYKNVKQKWLNIDNKCLTNDIDFSLSASHYAWYHSVQLHFNTYEKPVFQSIYSILPHHECFINHSIWQLIRQMCKLTYIWVHRYWHQHYTTVEKAIMLLLIVPFTKILSSLQRHILTDNWWII